MHKPKWVKTCWVQKGKEVIIWNRGIPGMCLPRSGVHAGSLTPGIRPRTRLSGSPVSVQKWPPLPKLLSYAALTPVVFLRRVFSPFPSTMCKILCMTFDPFYSGFFESQDQRSRPQWLTDCNCDRFFAVLWALFTWSLRNEYNRIRRVVQVDPA